MSQEITNIVLSVLGLASVIVSGISIWLAIHSNKLSKKAIEMTGITYQSQITPELSGSFIYKSITSYSNSPNKISHCEFILKNSSRGEARILDIVFNPINIIIKKRDPFPLVIMYNNETTIQVDVE